MPLDPQIAALLAAMDALQAPAVATQDPALARAGFRRLTVEYRDPAAFAPVASVTDETIPGPAGRLPARVFRPQRSGRLPTVVFFHGGGWVLGDLDTHEAQARRICDLVGAVVISVDYRLAPEHPFPAAVADALAASAWVLDQARLLGGDPDLVAVAGDSAGGNLAAVAAQAHRDRIAAQLLIYPAVDADPEADYASRVANASGYFLTEADMRYFIGHYVPAGSDWRDPLLSPLYGQLAGAPPAVVLTAEYDPLRDEGAAYAAALAAAGVVVRHHDFPGLVHGFFGMGEASAAAAAAVETGCRELASLLAVTGRASEDNQPKSASPQMARTGGFPDRAER